MASYVALLRGVNVGKAKRVAMADLRAMVEGLGYGGVRTLLNSGNVVFDAEAGEGERAAGRIEAAMEAKLGVRARVMVVDADELDRLIDDNPLAEVADNPSRLLVAVVDDPARLTGLAPVAAQDWSPERLAVTDRAAYSWHPQGISAGKLALATFKGLRDGGTTRNIATLAKLRDLARGARA